MGLFDDGLKVGTGLAIGIGALILVPAVVPVLAAAGKPLTKAFIKGGMAVALKGREMLAEAREVVEDLVAEAAAELSQETEQGATAVASQEGGSESAA